MYDVNFIEPKSDSEKRQELIESINRYSDKRLSKGQKEVLQRAIENLPNILDAQQLFDWLTIARADSFNFDYTPVYSNSKIAVLKNSEILNGCINPKINETTSQRDYLNENKLIIGDNFDALNNLLLTHKGKIDVIYIDPPYNTDAMKNDGNHADERLLETLDQKTEDGKSKFIYNDSFYRDDWLSMMKLRLEKAKKLMSAGGVIFVSIDDSEQAYLKVLMDEIFGEENFVSTLSVENNPKGRKNSKFVSVTNDFLLIYCKDKENIYFLETIPKSEEDMILDENGEYIHNSGKRVIVGENKFNKSVTRYDSDKHYSVYFNEKLNDIVLKKEESVDEVDQNLIDKHYQRYISYLDNKFVENTYSAKRFYELFKDKLLDFKQNKIYEKNKNNLIRIKSLLVNKKYRAIVNNKITEYVLDFKTTSAKQFLNSILDENEFNYPKNLSFIKQLMMLIPNKNATVLDFFAGSGTTGQAVMELNREDGGNRKFILCTNNQNKIGETVCAERLYRVITGKTSDGKSDFDWIKNNNPYSNESIGIYETKIMDLTFNPKISNVLKVQDLGNDVIRVLSQFSNEIINENVFNSLTTLPIIENIKRDNNPSDVIYSLLKNIDNNIFDIKLTKSGEEIHLNVVSNNNSKIYEIDLKELKITEQDVIDKICNLNQDLNNKNYSEVTKIVDEFIQANKNWFQKIY